MSVYDNMIERFETPMGVLGYLDDGYLLADRFPDIVDGFCPVWNGLRAVQNPARIASLFRRGKGGDLSVIGESDGMNDAGLEITATGVHAEVSPDRWNTYEQELTFAEFEPILEVWEKAWAAAQAYRARQRSDA